MAAEKVSRARSFVILETTSLGGVDLCRGSESRERKR